MALTLNAAFLEKARKGISEPRFLVEIWVSQTVSYKFLTGINPNAPDIPQSCQKVTPVTRSLDFKTRKTGVPQASLTFVRDALWETILNTYAVKGAYVDIRFGFSGLIEANFEPHAVLTVEKVKETETSIELLGKAIMQRTRDEDLYWQWLGLHPLQIARNILSQTGTPNSRVDLTALDPANHTDISHFVCTRAHCSQGSLTIGNGMEKAEKGSVLLDEIATILGGVFYDDENGDVTFSKFDPGAAAVDNWVEEDITDLVVEPLYENLINQVSVKTRPYGYHEDYKLWHTFSDGDVTSKNDFATVVPGAASVDSVKDLPLESRWITGAGYLYSDFVSDVQPGNGSTFKVRGLMTHAFCGTAWRDITHYDFHSDSNFETGAQYAYHQISVARPAYIRIGNEIIKCTAAAITAGTPCQTGLANTAVLSEPGIYGDRTFVTVPSEITFTIANPGGRGALGTTAGAHDGADGGTTDPVKAIDVTIQQYIAHLWVSRLKNGGQVIRCRTGLDKYATQIADLITLTLPASRFRSKNRAGLDTNTKFEVTEKALELETNPPGLKWTLVEASWTGEPARNAGWLAPATYETAWSNLGDAVMSADIAERHATTGLDIKATVGFNVTFNKGVASGLTSRVDISEELTFTVNANKDTYFAVDILTGSVSPYEVANLAAQPIINPSEMFLTKAVSDGAGITGTTDMRSLKAINGAKLVDASVDTIQMAANAVDATILAANSVVAGDLTAGAVSASTQIAEKIVGTQQSLGADRRNTINRNGNFLQNTRG